MDAKERCLGTSFKKKYLAVKGETRYKKILSVSGGMRKHNKGYKHTVLLYTVLYGIQ